MQLFSTCANIIEEKAILFTEVERLQRRGADVKLSCLKYLFSLFEEILEKK